MPIVQQGSATTPTVSSQGIQVDSILSRLNRECGDKPPDGGLALNWLEQRYRQVWNAMEWPFAIKSSVFQTVAEITAGTVTITEGSTTVSETTTNANGWSTSVEGEYFRATGDTEFYKVSSFTNGTPDTVTLSRAYEGETATLKGYKIFQNIYSLTTDVGRIDEFTDLHTGTELDPVSQAQLDQGFPNRGGHSTQPSYWAPAGRDANDIYQVEVYPIPTEVHGIQYRYIQEAPFLTHGGNSIVPQVSESLLKHGWKADYWNWRATMDDSTGQEFNFAMRSEALFMKELNEMAARELTNLPPQKIRFAKRYIRHRGVRTYPYRYSHSDTEMGL